MPTSRREIQERFHRAALEAYDRHEFRSYRHAEQVTGVNYSTIYAIVSVGRIPTRGQLIQWAEGIGEPINKWLELAGYDPISPTLVSSEGTDAEEEYLVVEAFRGARTEEARRRMLEAMREILKEEREQGEQGKD